MPKWIRDSGGRLVKLETPHTKELELTLNIMENTPEDQHSHHGHQDNPNEFRSMRDHMHPPRMSAPSCIVPPTEQLVIRPHIVPLLPTFHGMESENPYAISRNLKMPRSIRTWTDLQAEFLKKFFPTHRTNGLKRQISNFSAKENEKFYECWERYMEAINACPHHGFDTWLLLKSQGDGMNRTRRSGKDEVSTKCFHAKAGMYTLNEDVDMKAKFAAMTRRLEELELKKMHEVQAVAETPVQVKHVLFVNLMNTWWRSALQFQLLEKCLENKQMSLDNSSPIAMLRMEYLQLKLEESSKFSWKPRAPQYQQPAQPSQPSNKLQDGWMQNDLSQKIDNLQYSISRLTNLNTVQEKGRFPSQPHQNPKGIHEVETHEGESSQVRDVKALITLRSASSNICKVPKGPCTIKRGLNVNKKAFLTEQVSAIIQCKSPLKYKDPGCPTISVMIGGKAISCYFKCNHCRNGLMQLTFGNMTLELNIFHMSKKQSPEEEEGPEEKGCLNPDVLATLQGWRRKEEILPFSIKRRDKMIPWVSPTQVVPKKSGITVVQNEKGEEIATRLTSGAGESLWPSFYCFLDGYSGYFQIEIDVEDQEKTTFTCPFGTYAYRRMPFGLCNAPATFQRCMLSIFSDMVERIMEVFMDDITIYGGIVLGHIISEKGIEVDKAKVELIAKLPSPTTVKGVRQFLGHAGFYRRFIQDFSKLSRPLCELLAKDAKAPNWQLPFEVMCDASDFAIGAVLGQREDGKPYVIYYASKTLNEAQRNYTTTEKELLVVVFALDKFRAYLRQERVENVVADHLSRLAIAHNSHVLPINDDFPEESLMLLEKAPWYAHIANYLVTGEVPSEWKAQDRKHFFAKIHAYYWEEPFLFKYCADQIIRKCVPEEEQQGILSHCHENACGGHFASQKTAMKVLQSGFTWPSLFKDSHIMVVLKFLKENIFSRFGVPKAIISDGEQLIRLFLACPLSSRLWQSMPLPVEVEYKAWWAIKRLNMDLIRAGAKRCLDLNEMEELRNDAYINSKVAKQRMKKWHDQLISNKELRNGQRVLLYDSRLHIFQGNSSQGG
ncbi:Retrovirus-related Pol polyprotein from transposon 17.6 [Vitis vinifera]|uniref:Retrovirus-related Pol polyprotein from transposon 17.6 n=1 Tax=Vitis vinifera TaxID=29760 RepID=A0A438FYF4_VITVI|nr:Retrovirus-related Pol polyprotein from transposon 17.6 [Vitis vinifera]